MQDKSNIIKGYRNPLPWEISRGYGSTHYCDFERILWIKPDGTFKRWIKSPYDGLRYYRG